MLSDLFHVPKLHFEDFSHLVECRPFRGIFRRAQAVQPAHPGLQVGEPKLDCGALFKEGDILHRPGEVIRDVYFPLDCLISATVTMAGARIAEAAIVGSREMAGINAFMGGRETNHTQYICQASGTAAKIDAESLLDEFNNVKAVRDVLLVYTQAYIAQLSQNVACNRIHTIKQRMARWILECRDRLNADDLTPTHEFISEMLGVRRAGITETAAELQQLGLIEYTRKRLRVVDPLGAGKSILRVLSCDSRRV